MVRLESIKYYKNYMINRKFTFQYGQIRKSMMKKIAKMMKTIYIPVWLDQKERRISYE